MAKTVCLAGKLPPGKRQLGGAISKTPILKGLKRHLIFTCRARGCDRLPPGCVAPPKILLRDRRSHMPRSTKQASPKTARRHGAPSGETSENPGIDREPVAERLDDDEKRPAKSDPSEDHLRLYLRQTRHGLLSREQETEICQRVEVAEKHLREHVSHFGSTARAHLEFARKLFAGEERLEHAVVAAGEDSRARKISGDIAPSQ